MKLFISYPRKDADIAEPLIMSLQSIGHDVWMDTDDLRGGELWRQKIVEAIENCDRFILILTPNTALSENVRKELDLADDANKTIIPVELEDTDITGSIKFHIAGLQIINFSQDFHLGMEALLISLDEGKPGNRMIAPEAARISKINPSFKAYDTDSTIKWRGRQIVVRGELSGKYLWTASDTIVFVDGYEIGRAGGFTHRDVVDGMFKHRNQSQAIRCVCSQGDFHVSINGEMIHHGKLILRNKGFSYIIVMGFFIIMLLCILSMFTNM